MFLTIIYFSRLQAGDILQEDIERPCCYECKSTISTTAPPTFSTSSTTLPSTTTNPPKCPQTCCLSKTNIDVSTERAGKLEWTSLPDSELVEFLFSPKDQGAVTVKVDFSKTIEMSGFKVSSSVESFQVFYKQDIQGSTYVPYRSDVTGEIYTFMVQNQTNLFLPNEETVFVRWIMIKQLKLVSDSVQEVSFDILGCCGACVPSSTLATLSTTLASSSGPTTSTQRTTVISTAVPSTVTPECKHGDILPKDNCTSYVCNEGKYVEVKVCNKVCKDDEQLVQLDEESCCECLPRSTTTSLPTTITTSACDSSTEAYLCHKKCGETSTTKCVDDYKNDPTLFMNNDRYSVISKCKCPPGYKLEDSLVTNDGIKYFCVQVDQCACIIDGIKHDQNSVWHPKDKFGEEMWCKECQCTDGIANCANKTCGITCGPGSILIEPTEKDHMCCYCAKIPTTTIFTTTSPFPITTTSSVCDGCRTVIGGINVCKPKGSYWSESNCVKCYCEEEGQATCNRTTCQTTKPPTCDPKKGEYLKVESDDDMCCNTTTCAVCNLENINVTKCDGTCDCPIPDEEGKTCPDEDKDNCPKPCQVGTKPQEYNFFIH